MMFSPINVAQKHGIRSLDTLASHNLDNLQRCHRDGLRYRIRHGIMDGRSVAVVEVATSFADRLISYLPSCCSLRHRFSRNIVMAMERDDCICQKTLALVSQRITLPYVSGSTWLRTYSTKGVYNPWWRTLSSDLDEATYNQDGAYCDHNKVQSKQHIGFYDVDKDYGIFSNFYRQATTLRLCVIDAPGLVSMATCSEIPFQAGKFYSNPELRKRILALRFPRHAYNLVHPPGGKRSEPQVDSGFYRQRRHIKLMLKLVRTRAQQDALFRRTLLATESKLLFEVTKKDRFWGCVFDPQTGKYDGSNMLGRIIMQVRDELREGMIPQVSMEEVKNSQGFGNFSWIRSVGEEREWK